MYVCIYFIYQTSHNMLAGRCKQEVHRGKIWRETDPVTGETRGPITKAAGRGAARNTAASCMMHVAIAAYQIPRNSFCCWCRFCPPYSPTLEKIRYPCSNILSLMQLAHHSVSSLEIKWCCVIYVTKTNTALQTEGHNSYKQLVC